MDKISPIKERVLQFLDFQSIKKIDFCESTGISYANMKGKGLFSEIGGSQIGKILSFYPQINAEWLLTGKGSMLKSSEVINKKYTSLESIKTGISSDQEVPLYDIEAAANLRTIFADKSQNIIDKIRIPQLPKCDGAVYVRGDSMYPLLKSGDIVVFKEIYNLEYITTGEMYLVDYCIDGDDYLVVKYIQKGDSEGKIKLVSYNEHHQSLDIPVSAIRSLAIVKASIRLNTMI